MSGAGLGALGVALLFLLLGLRTPVAFAMLLVGHLGLWAIDGPRAAGAVLVNETWSVVSSYPLIVVPMFVLLGNIASAAGMSRGLYDAAYAWVGRWRGGLASASVLGCAAFSAVSGSSVATAVTIGKVALPQMRRFGYAPGLATGAVAAGGTLGFLIPPSTGFVLYAILTEQSIGRLFMAGVVPGLLLTGLFLATVAIVARRDPAAGPPGPAFTTAEQLRALAGATPLLLVILLTIGGIYVGAFTPVEASAVGAGLVLLLALAGRALGRGPLFGAVLDTVRTSAMLYAIVIGASVLNPFLARTGLPAGLGTALVGLGLGPWGTMALIVLGYIVLGTFLDGLAMLVVTLPIVFPIVVGQGFDPIWFGVVVVIVIEMGMITPPVGLNVFVVRAVAEDVPLATVFKGVLPFLVAMLVCLLAIALVPELALFLPSRMFG